MADLHELNLNYMLTDNSNKEVTRPDRRGFLGNLKKSTQIENTESSLKKSQSSNNFAFDLENKEKTVTSEPIAEETFVFRRRGTSNVKYVLYSFKKIKRVS